MTIDNRPKIAHKARVRNSSCSECHSRLAIDSAKPWAIITTSGAVCPDCAARTPDLAGLARVLSLIPPGNYVARPGLCVAPATLQSNTMWQGVPVRPRPFEVMAEGNGYYLSVEAGEDSVPAIAHALYQFYSTTPAPRQAKQALPPETAEERAVRERRRRDHEVAKLVSHALGTTNHRCVASLVEAMRMLAAR